MQFVTGVQTLPLPQAALPPRVQGGKGVKETLGDIKGGTLVLAPMVAARAKHRKIRSLEGCIVIEIRILIGRRTYMSARREAIFL